MLACCPVAGPAQENLRKELAPLAKKIKEVLDQQRQDAIAVGDFSGPAHLPGNGALIRKTLEEELKKQGVNVQAGAKNFEVKGAFRDAADARANGLVGVKLVTTIYDTSGEIIVNLPTRIVHGNTDLMAVLAVNASPDPRGDQFSRNKEIAERIENPQAHLTGNLIRDKANSPYAIEIRVKREGQSYVPVRPTIVNRLPHVALQRDDVYEVVLYNDSPNEAAVSLLIDGLNMFVLSAGRDPKDGPDHFSRLIVDPGKPYAVLDWHIKGTRTDEFLVTEKEGSVAAKLRNSGGVGTITAIFSAAWPKGKDDLRPADEPKTRSAELGTGTGQQVDEKYVKVERSFGAPRATISVRYQK